MVDVSELNTMINTMRTVAPNDLIVPRDHNFQNDLIKKIRSILAGIAVAGFAEGEYSVYGTKHLIQTDSNTRYPRLEHAWNGDESKFLYVCTGGNLIVIDVASGVLTDTGAKAAYSGDRTYASASFYGKYFVINDYANGAWTKVYKNGVLIQTINVIDPAKDAMYYPIISPTGKYIAVGYYDGNEIPALRDKLRIYEGS